MGVSAAFRLCNNSDPLLGDLLLRILLLLLVFAASTESLSTYSKVGLCTSAVSNSPAARCLVLDGEEAEEEGEKILK